MKRPQSAKPGYKGYWGQVSSDDFNQNGAQQKNQHRKIVKVMKPDLTTHDFARILPKKIYQDKQRLYSEALQLKQNLNQTVEENIRLKTKITILEKEREKMNKYLDQTPEGNASNKANSRINSYAGKSSEKENMMVRNLKKIIKDSKDENEFLKQENTKIKKAIKYTKINELEIQRKMLLDENKRINSILQSMNEQLLNQDQCQRQIQQLKKYLEEQIEQNRQLAEANQKYEEVIESLEEKLKSQSEKAQNKQKKLQRQLALEKRKVQQSAKYTQDLKKQLKTLKEANAANQQKKKFVSAKPMVRPSTSNPNNRIELAPSPSQRIQTETKQKVIEIQNKNQQLEQELKDIKLKLEQSEQELKKRAVSQKDQSNSPSKIQKKKKEVEQKKQPPNEIKKKEEDDDQQYEQQFQSKEDLKESPNKYSKKSKQEEQIQKYKIDFEENEQEEQLYMKDETQHKHSADKDKSNKKKKKTVTKTYKPDKKALAQIKELLTYRMKSQRYPFQDLKSDIEAAETTNFSYSDLCNMLLNEPFFLTQKYAKDFLQYCFQTDKLKEDLQLDNITLINKLRKVIEDFPLLEQNEEKEMIVRIAEMTSTYPEELQTAFQNIKNGPDTVSKKDLIQMFKKLELEENYIEVIIAELSLCSADLQHLNFHGFFDRFYIEPSQEQDNNAINEEQVQSSGDDRVQSSRAKKNSSSKPLRDDDEPRQPKFVLEDNRNQQFADDEDIVSDDGRI